jgi:endonuclease/exonuclease/phosphatase family metal-dependent hydrolase
MKKVLLYFILFITALLILINSFLIWVNVNEYKAAPIQEENIFFHNDKKPITDTIQLMTWNIGYAGLGSGMDFFYDGGKNVRTSKELSFINFHHILNQVKSSDSIDFLLLQEIDTRSKRSYYVNQLEIIQRTLEMHYSFAMNYKVIFVPQPLHAPYGKIESGLATFSRIRPCEAQRYSYTSDQTWPMRLFFPKRCFLMTRYQVKGQKELVLINTHNSAFDQGEERKMQMDQLKEVLLQEYEKGNYVIAGGDWNQNPPDYQSNKQSDFFKVLNVEKNYPAKGWQWTYDIHVPSNRNLDQAYDSLTGAFNILDFFLLSPNIEILHTKCIDLKFKHSDHHPVITKMILMADTSKSSNETEYQE